MASPVITRPLYVNGQWVPGVVILDRNLDTLEAFVNTKAISPAGGPVVHAVQHHRIIDASLGSLTPMDKCASAIDALRKHLVTNGYKPIP